MHKSMNFVPSPSWFMPKIGDTSFQGHLAYGSRHTIVVLDAQAQLQDIISAHDNRVLSLCFCKIKTSLLLASGGEDGYIKVWNLKDKSSLVTSYLQDKKEVRVVEWKYGSEDKIFFAYSRVLKEFNLQQRSCMQIKCSLKENILNLASCPSDPNILAVGFESGTVGIFNVQSYKLIHKLHGHVARITTISWCSGSSTSFASSSSDGTTRVWSISNEKNDVKSVVFMGRSGKRNDMSAKDKAWVSSSCHPTDPSLVVVTNCCGDVIVWCYTEDKPMKKVLNREAGGHERAVFTIIPNNFDDKIFISFGIDRHITFWDLNLNKSVLQMSTISGRIQCLSFAPQDNVRLAIGCGDSVIRVWNTSVGAKGPAKTILHGMRARVTVVLWHPEKDGILAFTTDEGRVGICDTSSNRYPSFFLDRHEDTVYSLSWGPCIPLSGTDPENASCLYLYSCGGGKVHIYSLSSFSKNAVDFDTLVDNSTCKIAEKNQPFRTEANWKSDYSLLAVGNESGFIEIYDGATFTLLSVCESLKRPINCLRWHEEYVSVSTSRSPMHNWLACGSCAYDVIVYDLAEIAEHNSEELSSMTKPVRLLKGHSDQITDVAWSPHIEGQLASASMDRTVQVWDVKSGQPMVNFRGHQSRVFAVHWSLLDPDIIFSGGDDWIVCQWKISEQTEVSPPVRHVFDKAQRRRRKRGNLAEEPQAVVQNNSASTNTCAADSGLIAEGSTEEVTSAIEQTAKVSEERSKDKDEECEPEEEDDDDSHVEETKNKVNKKSEVKEKIYPYLKAFSLSMLRKKADLIADGMKIVDMVTQSNSEVPCDYQLDFEKGDPLYLSLFADKATLYRALDVEKQYSRDKEHTVPSFFYDVWNGDIKGSILTAIEKEQLSDLHVSLAPLVSRAFWLETCEKYAIQLMNKRNYPKAVTYFLACNKVYDAINMLKNMGNPRDAVALAKVRLPESEPAVAEMFEVWGSKAENLRHVDTACHSFIAANQPLKAAAIVGERCDALSTHLAAYICHHFKYFDEAKNYTLKCLTDSLKKNKWSVARECLALVPSLSGLLAVVDVHESIVSLLNTENKNFGLQVEVFNDSVCEDEVIVWKCYSIDGQSYIQHLLSTIFSKVVDPASESFKTAFEEIKSLLHGVQISHNLSTIVYSVALNISMLAFTVKSCGRNATADVLNYINTALSDSLNAVEANFFDIITQLVFPFDVIWSSKEKKIKILPSEANTQGAMDLFASAVAEEILNIPIFKTQNYVASAGLSYTHIPESHEIEKVLTSISPLDVLLAFFSINLFDKLKEQTLKRENFTCCAIGNNKELVTEMKIGDTLAECAGESNTCFDSVDDSVSECQRTANTTGVEIAENVDVPETFVQNSEIETVDVLTNENNISEQACDGSEIKQRPELESSMHSYCCEMSELFFKLSQVFAACVLKDAFAIKHYLEKQKHKIVTLLLPLRMKERNKKIASLVGVPNADSSVQVVENTLVSNEHAKGEDIEKDPSLELTNTEGSTSTIELEQQHDHVSSLQEVLNDRAKCQIVPDCIPVVLVIKELCEIIHNKVNCPNVQSLADTFSMQVQAWFQNFVVT